MTSDKAYSTESRLANWYALNPVVIASGTTLINQLTDITISGLSVTVTAAMFAATPTYNIRGVVRGVNGSVIAQQAVGINGPAASSCNVDVKIYSATASTFKAFGEITTLGGRVGTQGNVAAGELFIAEYDGLITFTAAGTIVITGSCVTAAADTWTAQARSRMFLSPGA